MTRVSRRLHRLLVLTALTVILGAGIWILGSGPIPAHEPAPTSDRSDTLVLAERVAASGFVAVRLRTPASGAAATAPRRHDHDNAVSSRLCLHTAECHRHTPLYTLLRAYRI